MGGGGSAVEFAVKSAVIWIMVLFAFYEASSFYLMYQDCAVRQESNERTLRMVGVCDSPAPLSADMQMACLTAERENRISVVTCAWRSMWAQGELLRVWHMFTESHWMLLGVASVLCACLTYFVSSLWAARQHRMFYREFLQMLPAAQPPPAAPSLTNGFFSDEKKRRKGVVIVSNDHTY